MHVILGLSSSFFINFFHFFDSFFAAPISIRIDILWAQLLLDFSTDHLETMHTWSEDVHVVLGLSCHYLFLTFCFFFFFFFNLVFLVVTR